MREFLHDKDKKDVRAGREVKKFFSTIGELGGEASTKEKVEAARDNGKLGGRPALPKSEVSAATLNTRAWRAQVRKERGMTIAELNKELSQHAKECGPCTQFEESGNTRHACRTGKRINRLIQRKKRG